MFCCGFFFAIAVVVVVVVVLFVCFNYISPGHLFGVRCAITSPTACVWSEKRALCLDQF